MKAYTKSRAGKCPTGPVIGMDTAPKTRGPCELDKRYTVKVVTEPHFSAMRLGQYRDEASAWVPR